MDNRVRALRYCIGWANVLDTGDRTQLEAVRAEIGDDYETLTDSLAALVLTLMGDKYDGATVSGLRQMIADTELMNDTRGDDDE
ncbi:hypothetical protein [Williamsia sp. D3]|uniref:hypothetical protein n=1 Tax=Williamsia sp. D3 TaxID=1313067 RepID=UPI0003D3451B|nr:hypothetical protein [Williamsia sp. D3]ETD31500.1 hypothetical protein W823_18935 [Williamsia sp. D3]